MAIAIDFDASLFMASRLDTGFSTLAFRLRVSAPLFDLQF